MSKRGIVGASLALVGVFVIVASWATDFVTMQGEWTVYTAECAGGSWQAKACSGKMKAAERYRFRALKAHREVLFWTVGEQGESGRFKACVIEDGRTWECPVNADSTRSITQRMALGHPVADAKAGSLPFHHIPKWKWVALQYGIPVGSSALD